MLEIEKNKNNHGYDVFNIITDSGSFQISYENNFDLYWSYLYTGDIDECREIKAFKITKENYFLYELFDMLFTSIKNKMPYYNYPYEIEGRNERKRIYGNSELYNGHEIRWYSDDFAYFDKASNFAIRKHDEYFTLLFTKSKVETFNGNYFKTYSIRIRTSGSRYSPYHIPFMSMYQKLKEYDPNYHQIHIDEYLYEESKKRVKTK